jgi:hypothetical protein
MSETKEKVEKKYQTEIFEYIKRRKGGMNYKVGVKYATVQGDAIKIGWSKCKTKEDVFIPADGISMAKARALGEICVHTPTPNCIKEDLRRFGARALRYFKNATKLELPV